MAETVALPDAGWQAASVFRDTCLATRGHGIEAAISTILARNGVREAQSLPAYGGGKPLRTFVGGKLEFLVRPGKGKSYGCFVALNGDSSLADR